MCEADKTFWCCFNTYKPSAKNKVTVEKGGKASVMNAQ